MSGHTCSVSSVTLPVPLSFVATVEMGEEVEDVVTEHVVVHGFAPLVVEDPSLTKGGPDNCSWTVRTVEEHLKSFGCGYRVSYASTLKMTSRTLVRGSHELRHGRRF